MQKRIAILYLASLTACTPLYGNYAKVSDVLNAQMADDSTRELTMLYPPASTHLLLSQDSNDAFGAELVQKLRESGYALKESSVATASAGTNDTTVSRSSLHATEAPAPAPAPAATNEAFGYVVDQIGEGLYRVTIAIGTNALSRVYRVAGNGIAPAGAWTRKE